jgi:hypothetical protein
MNVSHEALDTATLPNSIMSLLSTTLVLTVLSSELRYEPISSTFPLNTVLFNVMVLLLAKVVEGSMMKELFLEWLEFSVVSKTIFSDTTLLTMHMI